MRIAYQDYASQSGNNTIFHNSTFPCAIIHRSTITIISPKRAYISLHRASPLPSHIRFVTRPSSIPSAYKKKKKRELVAEHVYDSLGESFFPLQRMILLQKRQDPTSVSRETNTSNWNVEQFSIYSRLISFNNNNSNKRLLFHKILVKEPSSNFFEINSSLERRALFVITRPSPTAGPSRANNRTRETKERRRLACKSDRVRCVAWVRACEKRRWNRLEQPEGRVMQKLGCRWPPLVNYVRRTTTGLTTL